jgi:hypothetical protein
MRFWKFFFEFFPSAFLHENFFFDMFDLFIHSPQKVISHIGDRASGGHYIAQVYCKDKGGWVSFDDAL